jgi:hypothetical protein
MSTAGARPWCDVRPFHQTGCSGWADRYMGLKAKINLALLVACAVGLALGAVALHRVFVDDIRAQVLQNARIMMSEADAIRRYTADSLVGLPPTERNGRFVAETVPDFAARSTFQNIQAAFPGYDYREPALIRPRRPMAPQRGKPTLSARSAAIPATRSWWSSVTLRSDRRSIWRGRSRSTRRRASGATVFRPPRRRL